MTNIINRSPYLPTQRQMPKNLEELTPELSKMYVDIANMVNVRSIGLFSTNKASITGDSWFISNVRQQTLRQLYTFTSTTAIPHGLDFTEIPRFTQMYGTYTDGTNWYGLLTTSSTSIAGQISFYIDSTNIQFVSGAGAPTLTSGSIVLEWLSNA